MAVGPARRNLTLEAAPLLPRTRRRHPTCNRSPLLGRTPCGAVPGAAARARMGGEPEMPWQPADVSRHNRSVKSPKRKKQWSAIANSVLKSSGDEGKAIRIANGLAKQL